MKENESQTTENDGFVSIEMPIQFYEKNIELFTSIDGIKLKSAYRKNKPPSGDKEYKERLEAFIEAKNNLLEYEVEMRYKQFLNYK